jgi:hypothetical protein
VRLLFDENLSRKLVVRLAELYPDSIHVAQAGLLECPDREIWEFAKAGNFVIVSTGTGLYELATTAGHLPRSCGSAAGRIRRGTRSRYCGARPSGSRNSRRIPNSQSSFLTATDALGADSVRSHKPT